GVATRLAVPGHYPHSPVSLSRAYTQLARIWYREDDVDSLEVLGSELAGWDKAQAHDKELVALIRIAIKLKSGDHKAVAEGFEGFTQAGVAHMDAPPLVGLSLEVGAE